MESMAETPLSKLNSQAYPVLFIADQNRMTRCGSTVDVAAGTIIVRQGEPMDRFVVVLSGALEVDQVSAFGTDLIATHGPGEFFGDVHLLSGRQSVVRARMVESVRIVLVHRTILRDLMQGATKLGEVLLRPFILRRLDLLSMGKGDAILLGSSKSVGTFTST